MTWARAVAARARAAEKEKEEKDYVNYYAEDYELGYQKHEHEKICEVTDISMADYTAAKEEYTICSKFPSPNGLGNEIFINKKYLQKIIDEYMVYKSIPISSGGKSKNTKKKFRKNTKKKLRKNTKKKFRKNTKKKYKKKLNMNSERHKDNKT